MATTLKMLGQVADGAGRPARWGPQRWCLWGVRLLVTSVILAWLLRQLDLRALQGVAWPPAVLPLLGMIGTAWVFVLLGGIKFWVLCHGLTPVPFASFMRHFLVATAFGAFTPASLGDFSLAALLRRERVPVHASMAVILVDRAVTMGMYAAVFLPLTLGLLLHTVPLWWIPLSVTAGALLVVALNGVGTVRRLVRRVLAYVPVPVLPAFLATTSALLRQHPWHLLGNVGLTLVRCLVSGLVVQCALWAVGEYAPFLPVLSTTNTIAILNLVPVSLAGLGVYESGGVTLLGQLGLHREHVFVALVYQRAYVLLSSLVILAFAYLYAGKVGWFRGHAGTPNHDPTRASEL